MKFQWYQPWQTRSHIYTWFVSLISWINLWTSFCQGWRSFPGYITTPKLWELPPQRPKNNNCSSETMTVQKQVLRVRIGLEMSIFFVFCVYIVFEYCVESMNSRCVQAFYLQSEPCPWDNHILLLWHHIFARVEKQCETERLEQFEAWAFVSQVFFVQTLVTDNSIGRPL